MVRPLNFLSDLYSFLLSLLEISLSEWPGAQLHELESAAQDRPRSLQKNKSRAPSSREVGPLPQAPPARLPTTSVMITQRITSLLTSRLGLPTQAI
jgi:hypothetical protein